MNLYNIHTHKIPLSDSIEGYNIISILNVYPQNYETQKEALQSSNMFYSCGIHPWYIDKQNVFSQYKHLSEIVKDKNCVAIGEAGLDKIRGADWKLQMEIFEIQIRLAIQENKPLIVHCVKAWDELITLYRKYNPNNAWIIHGFRGNLQQAKQLTNIGFKLSISSKFNEDVVRNIPLTSLFCETDDDNDSVLSIYHKISTFLQISIGSIADIIENNITFSFKL